MRYPSHQHNLRYSVGHIAVTDYVAFKLVLPTSCPFFNTLLTNLRVSSERIQSRRLAYVKYLHCEV
jgi:hypothetical protein